MKKPVEHPAPAGSQHGSPQGQVGANFDATYRRLLQGASAANDSELARALGITPQSVKGSKDKSKIPSSWITKISKENEVSADWLLYGVGAMKRGAAGAAAGQVVPDDEAMAAGLVLVPKVKARLSAGGGSFETNGGVSGLFAFRAQWIRSKGKAGQMVLMEVAGDSMEPVICDNDTVLIDQSQTEVLSGKVYAVGIDETVVIKRVDVAPGKLLLKSENKDYEPIEVPVGEDAGSVRIIGRVVWWCREAR